jgi:hypothetical protein
MTGATTDHSLSKGMRREDILKEYLSDNLPEVVGVSEGQVVDSEWNASKQCDLILYSRLSLCFKNPDVRLFPSDSVLAALEVKSYLNKNEIGDSVDKISTVKKMHVGSSQVIIGGTKDWIVGCVVAFEADSIETVSKNIIETYREKSIPEKEQIDLIYIQDQALGIKKPKNLGLKITQPENPDNPDLSNKNLVWLMCGEDSLLVFTIILAHALNNPMNMTRNYFKYISRFDHRTIAWDE